MKRAVCSVLTAFLLFGITLAASAGDEADVATAMHMWKENLAVGTAKNPDKILSLYARDAVLWGTISGKIRPTPALIRAYFVNAYKKLPKLTVVFKDPLIRVYGNTAINTGYYTFSYVKKGKTKTLPARYSFTLIKRGGDWLLVDHHSSGMPKAPK